MPTLLHLGTLKVMDPAELFGNESERILSACQEAFKNWIHPYEGCYCSPFRPTMKDFCKTSTGESLITAYKEAMAKWKTTYPEEASKEEDSLKEWEVQRDRQFRIIYGIARQHGLYLEWHGPSCGDQWSVYRHKERIARICCM